MKDKNINDLAKKFSKPNYATQPNSWEMDIMFAENSQNDKHKKQYLVLININTRFLIVKPIKYKDEESISKALQEVLDSGIKIDYMKCDGEAAFCSPIVVSLIYNEGNRRKFYVDSSPYTFHNKSVDSVIRTIRNAAGLDARMLKQDV